ncbi:MAG: secretin N-terminal domain-containing protein [Pseudohongiellaceae bacterium]
MQYKHRINFKRHILSAGIVVALSSCASMQDQTSPASTTPRQPETSTATTFPGQQNVAVIPGTADDEQRELIEQINRDGQRTSVDGFRDQAPQPVEVDGENVVELNYEQADLRLVLEELAEALDITLVIDPTIDNRVSIRTSADRPLAREDIFPLIRLLTRDAGVSLERVGNVYNVRRAPGSIPVEITGPDSDFDASAAMVMQITPLTYVSSESAMEVLTPILAEQGQVRQISNNNVLAISAGPSELARVNELLGLIDADPFQNQGIQVYRLDNSSALDVADELNEILQLIEGENPAYQVKGIERINALLITAPATRGFDEISRWVRILDAESQDQVEQLFRYRVKNLNAGELADTLTQVFERQQEDVSIGVAAAPEPPRLTAEERLLNRLTDNEEPDDVEADVVGAQAPGGQDGAAAAVSANLDVTIVADEASNSLLIRSSARDYRQLLTTISQLDNVPLQVMINAVIAQVTLTDDNRFGIDWSRVAADVSDPISTETATSFLPGGGLGGLIFDKTFIDGSARVDATLEAIAINNDVRLLARPSLTVVNNQEGIINIGAEVPIRLGTESTIGGGTISNIQYRQTGIELTILPQINDDGVVNLVITQSLSSVAASSGLDDNPIFNNQDITTSVVVRNGENVVLGGLIQNNNEDLDTGIPVLNRIPVVGGLFSYQQFNNERRELFIVLRPEVIDLNEPNTIQYRDILARFELAAEMFEEAGL